MSYFSSHKKWYWLLMRVRKWTYFSTKFIVACIFSVFCFFFFVKDFTKFSLLVWMNCFLQFILSKQFWLLWCDFLFLYVLCMFFMNCFYEGLYQRAMLCMPGLCFVFCSSFLRFLEGKGLVCCVFCGDGPGICVFWVSRKLLFTYVPYIHLLFNKFCY